MAEQKIIDVEPRYLKMAQSIFARSLPFKKVWAFGSRVKWTARQSSDLDCVVFGATDSEIYKAKEAFDESEIPFEVQLLNFETIPKDFKENIKKEYFVVRRESDWGEFKLGDLGQIVTGKTPSSLKPELFGEIYPFLTPTDIDTASRYIKSARFLSDKGFDCQKHLALPKNSICIVCIGSTIGKICMTGYDLSFTNQQINSVIVNEGEHNPFFVYYLLNILTNHLKSHAGGAAVPIINKTDFSKIEISAPSLPIQHKIAGILSAYDDLIENNNKRIKILEEMAQMIYKEWFVDFKFPNHQNTKFVDCELGKIPEGWSFKSIKNCGAVHTGKTPSTKNPDNFGNFMPFIKTPDMHSGIFCTETNEYLSKIGALSQKNKILPANSLCVSCIGTAGVVSITTAESQTNQQINSIILKNIIHREFMYFALSGLKETILQYGSTGATMANLSKSKFEELDILLPKEDLIENFSDLTRAFFDQIKNLSFKNQNLRQTRDLLLPRLISGELSVENLEVKI